ncbi:MAG TPA: hypothetical protein VEB86_15850 [Chryseosolibacter sp.]|nr:hypothetical protein [Chryseosolibacter sp.]
MASVSLCGDTTRNLTLKDVPLSANSAGIGTKRFRKSTRTYSHGLKKTLDSAREYRGWSQYMLYREAKRKVYLREHKPGIATTIIASTKVANRFSGDIQEQQVRDLIFT